MASPTYLALAVVLALGSIKILIELFNRVRSPLSSIPGPWYSRWTSIVLDYKFFRGRRAIYVEALHRQMVVRLSPFEVDFSSVTAAKRIHSYRDPIPKSPFYHLFRIRSNHDNVFSTTDIEHHARLRRLLQGPMSESNLKTMESVVTERVDFAIRRIGEEMKERGCADVMKWWMFLTTDVIGELTFGESFRMLDIGKPTQYAEDLKMVGFVSGIRVSSPNLFPILSRLPIPVFRKARAALERIEVYAEESIQRYRQILAADPINPKLTLFTKVFQDKSLSEEELVVEARGYIVAGSDTTANSLTYLTWAVCRNEAVKRKLVEEVAGLPNNYADEDLKKLPYLGHVIEETLRLYAAAPSGLPREVPKGGCDVDGYWIPGQTIVTTQAYSMHRDAVLFPQPERFDPSRWESPTKDMKDAWMPFGGGSRSCLGLNLAKMELRKATALFFRTFPNAKVSSLEGFNDDDMEQVIYFLIFPKNKRCLIEAS